MTVCVFGVGLGGGGGGGREGGRKERVSFLFVCCEVVEWSRKVGRKKRKTLVIDVPSLALSLSPSSPLRSPPILTSLRVQLPQHLPDDLPDRLQRLQVVLGLVVVLAQAAHRVAEGAGTGVGLGVQHEHAAVLGDGRGALVGGAGQLLPRGAAAATSAIGSY